MRREMGKLIGKPAGKRKPGVMKTRIMKTYAMRKAAVMALATALLVMLAASGLAKPVSVRILGFHYEEKGGEKSLSLTDSFTKLGYYPDYKLQPESGFTLKILDGSDAELFSVKFISPARIYYHEYHEDEITGGLLILNETDFAMTIPVLQNESKIVILDESGKNVFSYSPPPAETSRAGGGLARGTGKATVGRIVIWTVLAVFLVAIFFAARRLKRKKQELDG
jgi:hypothetical protein